MSGWWNKIITSEPPRRSTLGMNSAMLRPQDLARLRQLGITHVRVPGILQRWETDFHYRAVIADMDRAARENNLRLLWMLHNVIDDRPQPADSLWHGEQWAYRMSEFCKHIALLPATEAIQPWNEVNGYRQQPFGFADGWEPEDIGNLYAKAFILHARAIYTVSPRILTITAGLTLTEGWDRCFNEIVRGCMPSAYAIHPYGPWALAHTSLIHAQRIAGYAPVWATEFGNDQLNGETIDLTHHKQCWRTFIEGNNSSGLAARMYGYALQVDGREEYSLHGLVHEDGSVRPAYDWLVDYQY